MVPHESNKLTCPQLCGFIAQFVEHCTAITEVMGLNPIKVAWIFQVSVRDNRLTYPSKGEGITSHSIYKNVDEEDDRNMQS